MINLSKSYFVFFTLGDWGGYKFKDQITMRAIGNQMHNFAKLIHQNTLFWEIIFTIKE